MRKQREFERKNVTADCYGCVIMIKPTTTEKLNSDFNFPKTILKENNEMVDQNLLSKAPQIPLKNNTKEEIKSKKQLKNKSPETTAVKKTPIEKIEAVAKEIKVEI